MLAQLAWMASCKSDFLCTLHLVTFDKLQGFPATWPFFVVAQQITGQSIIHNIKSFIRLYSMNSSVPSLEMV